MGQEVVHFVTPMVYFIESSCTGTEILLVLS